MKEKRILRVLGEVDEKYIEEAAWGKQSRRKLSLRKTLLIAACLILALALIACAANWFGLRNLLLPQKVEIIPSIQDDPKQVPYKVDVITLAGFTDTPESKASAQWQAFLAEYNYISSSNEIFAPGTSYNFYQVNDQTMADKLDEIIAQYGLKLHTGIKDVDKETLCQLVGGDFMGENRGYGYIYEDGSFHIEGNIELPNYGLLDYQMSRCVRGTFSDVILNVNDIDQWREWGYTTKGGTAMTLALSPTRGVLIAELSDSFVTINVLAGMETNPADAFSSDSIGKAQLEALAESFDFSLLTPALPVEIDAVQPNSIMPTVPPVTEESKAEGCPNLAMAETYTNCGDAYAALLEDLLVYRIFPDGYPYEPFDDTPDKFALIDVNSDGTKELLLSASNTSIGGMRFYVLAFDTESGRLRVEMLEWPALIFYENGLAKAELSHNQGRAGDALWPYTLYRYDTDAQVYIAVAMVDAWDQQFGETYLDEPFPSEADTSSTGVVYYVMEPGNYELKNPMDISEYQQWCDSWFGSETPIPVPWTSLTEEAIRNIRKDGI